MSRCVRWLMVTASAVCTLGAVAVLGPSIASAQVGTTSPATSLGLDTCSVSAVSQPFARWLDFANYELTPGGDFESPMWAMTGGAALVPGSEPYAATGSLGSWSLSLPASSSAQSPAMCVAATDPSVRFFVAGTGSVQVSIVHGSSVIPAGVVVAGGAWAPSPAVVNSSAVTAAMADGTAQVSVSLTALSGSPRIDDVFIDPWSRG